MKEREVLPLPIEIEEIDREWLTAALRTRAPGATVEHFEIVNVDHGTCTMVRIKLEMDEVGLAAGIPSLVILKGGFEPHSRSMFFEHDRESRWYRDVLPVLELRAPAAYFADVDEERLQGIVIMDDLVARGVRFCDPLIPEGFEQARRCLSSLAAYHAKSWNSPDLEPGGRWDWLDDERDGILPYFEGWGYFEPDNFQRFATSPRGAACSVKFLDVEWVHSSIRKLARVAEDLPRCIVHSDPHLGNLYEDIDGTPGFFDSRPMKMVPYRDMIYYITCALDPADRRRWDGALVQHYLDELARNGVVAPGFDEMMFYFSIFLVHGFLIFLENPSHYQPEAVNTAFAARFSAAMIDHRTREMLETIP